MTPTYDITTIAGDGIGPEVCQSAVTVLREACGSRLRFDAQPGGAAHYLRSGAAEGRLPTEEAREELDAWMSVLRDDSRG